MAKKILTQTYIRTLFEYKDGELYWLISRSNRVKVGDKAGCSSKGYKVMNLDRKIVGLHVLVWIYHYGVPNTGIDHINKNPSDNRIENLRLADKSQNGCNRPKQKNNKSGFKNVSWYKTKQKWKVALQHKNKSIHIGYFED